jgi:hypothetical protein
VKAQASTGHSPSRSLESMKLLKNTGFIQLEYIGGIKLMENQIWQNAMVSK